MEPKTSKLYRGNVCHPLWFITTAKYVHMFSFQIEIVKGQGRAVCLSFSCTT